jgi:hypothetical protein
MLFEMMFATFVKLYLQHLWKKMFARQKNEDFIKFIQKYSLVLCMGVEMGKKNITNLIIGFSKRLQEQKNKMFCRKK